MRPVTFLSLAFFYQGVLSQLVCRDGQLRLSSSNQLWACRSGQWGTVCSNDFELSDAVVACRNLGYGVEESEISYGSVKSVSDFVALSSLDCDGSEDYLWDCVHSYTECQMFGDVTLECPSSSCVHGELRLVNGFSSTEGTLEICKNGSWNTLCKDGFGGQEAYVACRQMGLSASNAEVTDTAFSTGHGWAEYTQFLCTGKESSLAECSYSLSSSCLSFDSYTGLVSVAQLKCLGDPAPETCSGSGIRINNNGEILTKGSGRLELCQSGAWGTVNNNMFSVKDSLVACRQLGVPSPSTQVYPQGYFTNNAAGPVILRDLVCVGSEQSLYSAADPPPGCSNGESTVDLDHSTDVFLNCWTKVGVSCNNGDVRLTNGSNKDEGRVEVCFGEEWGTFCDNFWDRREARVICNQLGYPNAYGAFYTESKFGTGDQVPYIYTDMNCSGLETGIVSCPLSDQIEGEKCLYGRAVGVKCYNNTGCTDGMVRLVGGSETEGDVQVCRHGVWGYICDQEWTENEARVVCRDQGFSDVWYGRSTFSLFGGSQDYAPIVYDSVDCIGSEDRLSDCTKSDYASLYPMCLKVAGVTCLRIDECENGQVRLNGGTSTEGRVEICTQGLWTTVKSNEIAYEDAQVICKQLGFDEEWSVMTLGNTWGTGDRMIYYDGINCDGSESTIIECAKTTISINTNANEWYSYERAGVSCENRQLAESCTDQGAIRLKDGASGQNGGRLEICLNNYWGSVCNRGWTQNNGLVACRQAGYETLRPLLSSAAFSDRMNGPVNTYNVNCNGHESKLTDCEWSNAIGESSCYHEEDVGLDCKVGPDLYSFITISSNREEPFPIGTSVTLTCEGAPATDDIMYSWSRDEIDMDVNTSSLTFTVGVNFRQSINVYCNVYRINENVGVGMRTFSVQGVVTADEGVVIAVPGQDITLSFNRQDTHINDYLLEPSWTFQGNDIDATQPRYAVSSDGLSLTITNVALTDYGIYSFQYNGLNLQAHNEFCEQMTLSLLRDYPVFSTGYIILTSSDALPDVEDSNHLLDQDYDIHNFTFGETLLRLTAGRSGAIPSEQQLQPEWFFNGAQYLSSPELTLRDHSPIYDFILQYPVLFDSGFYELVLKFPFEDLMTSSGCSREYGSRYLEFLQSEGFMGFDNNYFLVDTAVIEVQYNEMPTAQLTTDKSSFMFSDDAIISCDGSGGYPRYFKIELWKGDALLINTSGLPHLDFNTANIPYGSRYGSYRCIVDNTLLIDTTSITVSNQEMISIMFRSGGCNNWNSSDVSAIEQAVLDRFDQTCSCRDDATLINSDLSCPLGGSTATFNTTLVYTNTDGTMLARDIVNSTLNEFNDRINRNLVISGTSYSISNGPPDPEDSFELSEGAILALMFVGGFLAAALISVAVIIAIVFMLRRPRDTATKQSDVHFHNQGGNSNVKITEDDIDDDFHPPPEDI